MVGEKTDYFGNLAVVLRCYKRASNECIYSDAGVAQLVECNLAKVDVAGSSPVSRSERIKMPHFMRHFHFRVFV